jgi:hypothetical protein
LPDRDERRNIALCGQTLSRSRTMRAYHVVSVAALLVAGACVDAPVTAPLNTDPSLVVAGSPDNGAHPYVGLLVFDDAPGHPAWRCSGSLLSSTVVLTAGHCTDGAVAARLWTDEVVTGNAEYPFSGATSYDGAPHTFPGFCVGCNGIGILSWVSGDVGIVVLSEPAPGASYLQLPSAGVVGTIAKKARIDLVGYGVQHELVGGGPPQWTGNLNRHTAPTQFVSGDFFNNGQIIRLTANPAQGKGGLCFGDSGGPDLLGGSNVAVAVNSYVTNNNCTGVTYSTRVDLPAILTWVQSFLP